MNEEIRVHRVGTLTAGISMVGFGIMFVVRNFVDAISYTAICRCWPVILILLGLEILFYNVRGKKLVYDKAAVFIIVMMMAYKLACENAKHIEEQIKIRRDVDV